MTCTPARSRACTTPRTCPSVNWWLMACEPSRRVESVIRRSRSPPAVGVWANTSDSVTSSVTTGTSSGRMVMSPMSDTGLLRVGADADERVRDVAELGRRLPRGRDAEPVGDHDVADPGRGRGDDVEVARVVGQVVAAALDLDRHEHAGHALPEVAGVVELGIGPQVVAGHVVLHLRDHRVDRREEPVLQQARFGSLRRDRAEDRVAHHQRRLHRVQDDDRLAPLGATDHLERLRGRLGELGDVRAGAGPGGPARDRRDDLGVRHGHDRGDGLDHRRGGLATAGDHVDVYRVEVEVEVDRRAEVRPDRGRGEVDGQDAGLRVARCVRRVRLGRGALEHDVGQLVLGEQPVHALGTGLQAERPRPAQTVGCRVDTDHPARVQHVAATHQLEHQVGADVAGADDGGGARGPGAGGHDAPQAVRTVQTKRAVTLPSPANVAVKVSPAATADMAQTAPGSTTWPASRVTPRAPTVLASQTRELTGEPRTAPPAPVPTTSPLRWKVAPARRRSTAPTSVGVDPSTTAPELALSAMVSNRRIFQSWIRLSTISRAGSTKSTARSASCTVTPGPLSGFFSTKAISGSMRGWTNRSTGIGMCSRWKKSSSRWP